MVVKQPKYKLKPRWKPGESGNPNGRPRKQFCIPDILRKILSEPHPEDELKTWLETICYTAVMQAAKGDKDARAWIADRVEGKALERVLNANVQKEEMKFDFGNL